MTARPRWFDLAAHLSRIAATLTLMFLLARTSHPVVQIALGVGLFFAAFALMHDLSHGALRLPRVWNEVALAASAALMLVSGHGVRLLHLRHHARPLHASDTEGATARLPLVQATLATPFLGLWYRVVAFRAAGPVGIRWQCSETLLNVVAFTTLTCSRVPALTTYAWTALTMQLLMPMWAGRIPHRAPAWVLDAAKRLSFLRSPVVLSLAFHELHHVHPSIPCHRLAIASRGRSPARSVTSSLTLRDARSPEAFVTSSDAGRRSSAARALV